MNVTKSQNRSRCNQTRMRGLVVLLMHFLVVFASSSVWAASENHTPLSIGRPELEETFGADTPLGRFSYQAGQGLRLGKTGLSIGGFTTAEMEHLENGERRGGIEELNFLISYDPVPFAHLFAELGVGSLAEVEGDGGYTPIPC
jgi:hypothetical protein